PENAGALLAAESPESLPHETTATALATVDQDDGADASESESALEKLAFQNIDVELALTKPSSAQAALLKTLQIGSLKLQGDVVHQTTGEVEQTSVRGSLTDLLLSLDDFPLAGRKFDLNQVKVEGESQFSAELENLKPLTCLIDLGR